MLAHISRWYFQSDLQEKLVEEEMRMYMYILISLVVLLDTLLIFIIILICTKYIFNKNKNKNKNKKDKIEMEWIQFISKNISELQIHKCILKLQTDFIIGEL